MNNDRIAGNWKQLMGDIQKQWPKLTNDHLVQIEGSSKKLAGTLQENYGIAQEAAEKQISDWEIARKKAADKLSQKGSK